MLIYWPTYFPKRKDVCFWDHHAVSICGYLT